MFRRMIGKRFWLFWVAIGYTAIGFAALARAEVQENIDYIYYEVSDPHSSGQTLKQALDKASPVVKEGVKRHGENRWLLRWQVEGVEEDGGCKVGQIVVKLNSTVLLPELVSESEKVQQQFNNYVELLQRHLLAHYVIAIQAANQIELDITNMAAAPSCDELSAEAEQIAEALIKKYKEKSIAFDEMTGYGEQQGVKLE